MLIYILTSFHNYMELLWSYFYYPLVESRGLAGIVLHSRPNSTWGPQGFGSGEFAVHLYECIVPSYVGIPVIPRNHMCKLNVSDQNNSCQICYKDSRDSVLKNQTKIPVVYACLILPVVVRIHSHKYTVIVINSYYSSAPVSLTNLLHTVGNISGRLVNQCP